MKYDFAVIEKKWQRKWQKSKIFEVKENSKKKKYYVLDMFPYPSGEGLHIGHAFVFSLGDIFARFKRLQGFNVLYPIGYDSLGLPAENAAIKVGVHPDNYTNKSISNFIKQQKAMGWSYDWTRMIKTSDPKFYKWDQWIFLKMLEKGIAYRKKAPVNWCSKCQTVLANEQVVNGKCWRHESINVKIKHLEQWFFRTTDYAEELINGLDKLDWSAKAKKMQKNWIGKSHGTEIDFEVKIVDKEGNVRSEKWPIFTTRPDTIHGVTFMVISAQHPRLMELVTKEKKKEVEKFLKKIKSVSEKDKVDLEKEGVFTGSYAVNPLTNEKIPIYAGNFVVADYGCGMVMAVPAHDQRDFEFAKKYGIKIKSVICPEKKDFDKQGVVSDFSRKDGMGKFQDKKVEGKISMQSWVDDKVTETYEQYKERIINEIKKNIFQGSAWTGEGVLINSGEFDGLSSKVAKEKITKYLEKKKLGKRTVNYKLKDWLISRQRYWGTPIPVVYCDKCGIVPVPEKELPVKLPKNVKFGKGNPLKTNEKFVNVKCPKCKGKARRETDTMDTFVNSSWYYLRYADAQNDKKIFDIRKVNYWAPVDQYIGGPEHITMHLIYIRFYTKFLRDLGLLKFDEPALKYFTQGIVKGIDGEKMSKSKGNVIEPLDMIKKYGADSLRLYLVSNSSPDKDFDWDDKGIQGSFKFLNKVYEYFKNFKAGKISLRIESKLNKTIKGLTLDVEEFRHNLSVIKIRALFNDFSNAGIDMKTAESFLKLLHIYCPHITEELWHKLGNKNFLILQKWPASDENKIDEKLEKQEQAVEKLTEDINHIVKIVEEKNGKVVKKAFVYVLPNEKKIYFEGADLIRKKINLNLEIFSVSDKDKYDPEFKSKKVKPNRPAIFLE